MRLLEGHKVDAFTTAAFSGNPAGVVLATEGPALSERIMQAIAREMNVSETAFLLPPTKPGADLRLRYFTPTSEIKLCGHATVATFHVLAEAGRMPKPIVKVETQVGILDVEVHDGEVFMSSDPIVIETPPVDAPETARLLGASEIRDPVLVKRMLFCTVAGLEEMGSLKPDLPAIARLYREANVDGVVAVSFETHDKKNVTHIRYFVPGVGIDEDPVTGAAHMALAGYLLHLGRISTPSTFYGEQGHFCGRAGQVRVEVAGDRIAPRVRIGGRAVTVFSGTFKLP